VEKSSFSALSKTTVSSSPAIFAAPYQLLAVCSPMGSDESPQALQPPAWLKVAVDMIFISEDTDLDIAQVAAYAGVHPVHLVRVFRRYLQCSPGDYLRDRRLEKAAAMIAAATASLADAA